MNLVSTPSVQHPKSDDLRDLELLDAVAREDKKAFEQLYIIYHRRLSRLLLRFFDRYGIVEEIINDTMLIVWEKAIKFEGRSKVSTWIMGIAYRRMSKTFKRFDRIKERELEYAERQLNDDLNDGEPSSQPNNVAQDWLAKAMNKLSSQQRLLLEFVYYCGYSCEEIGVITQMPTGTVKTHLYQARKQLKQTLPALAEPTTQSSVTNINRGGCYEPQ